jgi:hypothetical protein
VFTRFAAESEDADVKNRDKISKDEEGRDQSGMSSLGKLFVFHHWDSRSARGIIANFPRRNRRRTAQMEIMK